MFQSLLLQFFLVPCEHVFVASGLLEFMTRYVSGSSTQNLLNQAMAPIERDLAVGYGEILLALAVTLVCSRPELLITTALFRRELRCCVGLMRAGNWIFGEQRV